MRQHARKIALLLTISLIAYSGYGFACNKENTVNQAAEAAKDIGGATRDVIKAVGEAYQAKLITLEQKDKLAGYLKLIAKGGQKGVDKLEQIQKSGGTVITGPDGDILNKIFSDEVVAPFLNLLTDLGKLSDTSSAAIRAALASLRTTIILLSGKIGRVDVIKQIEARERIYA